MMARIYDYTAQVEDGYVLAFRDARGTDMVLQHFDARHGGDGFSTVVHPMTVEAFRQAIRRAGAGSPLWRVRASRKAIEEQAMLIEELFAPLPLEFKTDTGTRTTRLQYIIAELRQQDQLPGTALERGALAKRIEADILDGRTVAGITPKN